MKIEKTFTLKKVAILSLISATMIYAFTEHNFGLEENKSQTTINHTYQYMTTAQLEKKVEEQSVKGDLPFDMGLELIKRWSNK